MPVYTYKCTNCGHIFDQRQRINEESLSECPVCHSRLRRVINPVGLVFKGSGFYVTDNRNGAAAVNTTAGAEKKADTAESAASKGSDDSGNTGNSSDSAAKTEKTPQATTTTAT